MKIGRFSKGIVVTSTIIALILGVAVISGLGYWVVSTSRQGMRTGIETECGANRVTYCNSLIYGGLATQWSEACGNPPSVEQCEALVGEGATTSSTTAIPTCGDGDLDADKGEECEPPDSENNDNCLQEAQCDYDNRKYGSPADEYGSCDSNCQCVLDELDWGEADSGEYCDNCAEHCDDGECNCGENSASCPEDCEEEITYNFKIGLYGDYDWTREFSTITIEGDQMGQACDEEDECTYCDSLDVGLTANIEEDDITNKYCLDGELEVSFSDYRVNEGCIANHQACIYKNDQWNCCEKECNKYGCSNSVVFDCDTWECISTDNFRIDIYGDYEGSGEYSSIIIEGDIDDALWDACLYKDCNNCEWNEGTVIDTIDVDKYCSDDKLEVSFSDVSSVDTNCKANHRACVYVNEAWKCCENECSDDGGCNNIVTFKCTDWTCL